METTTILFFGSTTDSVIVLEKLAHATVEQRTFSIVGVVTQPPKPIGRKRIITPTPVEIWGKAHTVPVLSFEGNTDKPWLYNDEKQVIDTLQSLKPDLLISASYGQKIPWETIEHAPLGGVNVHPSLLPRWRGADPVPWAILSDDHQIGVSIVTLSEKFDEGKILAQEKIPLMPNDTSDPLREKLFSLGAALLVETLPSYICGKNTGHVQKDPDSPYAKKLTRDDGFEPWDILEKALAGSTDTARIERKFRAISPWPSLWTMVKTHEKEKRVKILALHADGDTLILDTVQLEGKNPVSWKQYIEAYPITS